MVKNYDNTLSRFHTIPERNGRTDGRTDLLYQWKVSGSSVCGWCVVWRLFLYGIFRSTWVVEGPNTWEATGGHGPGDVRVGWRAITDGLVAWGDWLVQPNSGKGRVTSSGSTPGLVARTSADPKTLRKVTSESVDNSSVEASVPGHWVSGTMPKASNSSGRFEVSKFSTEFRLFSHSSGGNIARQKLIRKPGRRGRTRHRSRRLDGVCRAWCVFNIRVGH